MVQVTMKEQDPAKVAGDFLTTNGLK
jgi:hypothetical protein